jgi:phosphoribosylformylglycinamidine cyclo-ligase
MMYNPSILHKWVSKMTNQRPQTYAEAGVNIDAGNALVEAIKPFCKATTRPEVLGGLGGFSALFELPVDRYQRPVLVSCTDGVGTKLVLAQELNHLEGIGIDCVAMCVNDMIVTGAEPLFFLDYYACGKLNVEQAAQVIKSVAAGCQQAGCALVGGETAEMPGLLANNDFDIAGFSVGVVEKDRIISGDTIAEGDPLIAVASSGPHSNGYSLIRALVNANREALHQPLPGGKTLAEALLAPTTIYVRALLPLAQQGLIKGMAHITGGGLLENVPRMLPEGLGADLERLTWDLPPVFQWIQNQGQIADQEMLRTFNCGVGMVLCVAEQNKNTVLDHCKAQGQQAWVIGRVSQTQEGMPRVRFSA